MSANRVYRFPTSARVRVADASPEALERRMRAFRTIGCPRCERPAGMSCRTSTGVAMRPEDAVHQARLDLLEG